MSSTDEEKKIQLRVPTYYAKVQEFERREDGSRIVGSLVGPARIEARAQDARDRVVAGAELKVLQERLRWCYHKEGVNHYENCKHIADLYIAKLKNHDSWLLKVGAGAGHFFYLVPPLVHTSPRGMGVEGRTYAGSFYRAAWVGWGALSGWRGCAKGHHFTAHTLLTL